MSIRADTALIACLLLLSGCGGKSDAPAPVNETVVEPSPTPVASPSPPPQQSSVPTAITVTTNEPFYSAVVAGNVVTLTGAGVPERRLQVVDREVTADARRWRTRDDRGEVVVSAARRACSDDMSGAPRDFTGLLIVDGREARGCAFTGTPAPPPGEADIPAQFVGRWNTDRAACAAPATSIEGVKVTPRELVFHESVGTVTAVRPAGPDGVRVTMDYEGEGERWTATQTLRIAGDRLIVDNAGRSVSRVRCPS